MLNNNKSHRNRHHVQEGTILTSEWPNSEDETDPAATRCSVSDLFIVSTSVWMLMCPDNFNSGKLQKEKTPDES